MPSAPNHAAPGLAHFFSPDYQAHNRACLTHLESLGLPLSNRRVLELGSGPGDHTGFFVRRQCSVVSVDARQDCLDMLKRRHPGVQTVLCDLNAPAPLRALGSFDVIHCYGVLYHLENPGELLAYMGEACSGLVLVQTCVLRGQGRRIELVEETPEDYTQSSTGRGCRPTRRWVFEELGRFFPFVYLTRTQPNHPEFPVDWSSLDHAPPLVRSVFVASKQPLSLPTLSPELLDLQERLDPKTYIAELELMLAARLKTLQEREQLIRRLHEEAAALRSASERRPRGMRALKWLKEALERRAAKLERVAEERLQALQAATREAELLRQEAERRADTIRELERVAAERLDALQAATREAELLRHEAERRELGLRELTAALQERDRRLAELQRPREEAAPTPPSS